MPPVFSTTSGYNPGRRFSPSDSGRRFPPPCFAMRAMAWARRCRPGDPFRIGTKGKTGVGRPRRGGSALKRAGLGLVGMRKRIQILGGDLRVESEPGCGTRIRASFPLSEVPEDRPAEPAG